MGQLPKFNTENEGMNNLWGICGYFGHTFCPYFCKKTKIFRHFKGISIIVFVIILALKNLESRHYVSVVHGWSWFVISTPILKRLIYHAWKGLKCVRQIDILGLDWIHWRPVVLPNFLTYRISYAENIHTWQKKEKP